MLERFTEPEYRHPLDARAMLVRVTQGCTWNRCAYCYVSKGYKFLQITDDEMRQQMRMKAGLYKPDTKIWMVGSNPLVLPTDTLLRHISVIREYYPHFSEIAMQTRVTDVRHKSMEELKALRDAGIHELFLGIESGDEDILKMLNKGATAAEGLEQMLRLNEAGIDIVPMYMLGGGGKGTWERNAAATAGLLNKVRSRMISTTGLTVFPGTELEKRRAEGTFTEAPEYEKVLEIRAFAEQLEAETYLFCRHYLNAVHFAADMPADKPKILKWLDDFLKAHSPDELDEMVSRSEMKTL